MASPTTSTPTVVASLPVVSRSVESASADLSTSNLPTTAPAQDAVQQLIPVHVQPTQPFVEPTKSGGASSITKTSSTLDDDEEDGDKTEESTSLIQSSTAVAPIATSKSSVTSTAISSSPIQAVSATITTTPKHVTGVPSSALVLAPAAAVIPAAVHTLGPQVTVPPPTPSSPPAGPAPPPLPNFPTVSVFVTIGILLVVGLWIGVPIGLFEYARTHWTKNFSILITTQIPIEIGLFGVFLALCAIDDIRDCLHRHGRYGYFIPLITLGIANVICTVAFFVYYKPTPDLTKVISFTQLESQFEDFQLQYVNDRYHHYSGNSESWSVIYCPTSVNFKAEAIGIPVDCSQPTPIFDDMYDPLTEGDDNNPWQIRYNTVFSIVSGYFNVTKPHFVILHCREFTCDNGDAIGCNDLLVNLPDPNYPNRTECVTLSSGQQLGPTAIITLVMVFISIMINMND